MPSFAHRAGIAFLYTPIGCLSYAMPGTHIFLFCRRKKYYLVDVVHSICEVGGDRFRGTGEKIYENFAFEIPLISMRPIFWSRDAVAT